MIVSCLSSPFLHYYLYLPGFSIEMRDTERERVWEIGSWRYRVGEVPWSAICKAEDSGKARDAIQSKSEHLRTKCVYGFTLSAQVGETDSVGPDSDGPEAKTVNIVFLCPFSLVKPSMGWWLNDVCQYQEGQFILLSPPIQMLISYGNTIRGSPRSPL